MGNGHRKAAPASRRDECVEDGPAARRGAQPQPAPPSAPLLAATRSLGVMPPPRTQRPRAGRFARCHLVRSTARPSTQTSTGLQYGVPRRARPTTSWEAGATSGGSRSTTTSRQVSLLANTGPQSQPYPQTEQPAGHLQLLADHAHHAVQKLSLSTVARSSRGRRGRLATTTP